ncbi:MAG: diguanylate cyclase, partial [Bacillota bacterium]|nr:diguanylate cyclase [Bacillota bacterium]
MPAKESLPVSMHTYASRPYNTYFGNAFRVMEFSACILFYIAITCLQAISIDNTQMKGVIAQIQAFIAIYLVLRYTFLGLSVMLTCNLLELINIFFSLVNVGDNSILIIALTVKLFTVSSIIIVCMLQVKQNKQKRELHRLVITDDLTDTYNRRFFYSTLDKLVEDTKKNNSSVGLILIDIDNFKSFNDNYGHDSGDKVLKATSNLLKDFAYDKDFVFRYAGDQFAILVPSVNLDSLQQKAEQLKETLYIEKNRYYEGYIGQDITLSMGLSVYPMVAKSMDELVSQADTALYHAKNLGKDKVNSYNDIIHHISGSTSFSDKQLIGLFKALLSSISAKDKYTFGHSERVSQYAGIIGDEMKLDPRDISILRYAGLFHDIGKIEVPTSILNKIEPLSQDEFR